MAASVVLTLLSSSTFAATLNVPIPAGTTKTVNSIVVHNLVTRLHEIKAMDKSKMSAGEKKELLTETRYIKNRMKEIGGGVYISAGALIIIILLIVILL